MSCNCKTEIEAQLAERFKAAKPEAHNHAVALQGYGFGIVGNTMVMRGGMAYKATALFPRKSGGTQTKTLHGQMVFAFCPFCGSKQG